MTPAIVPAGRPEQPRATSVAVLEWHGVLDQFAVLGMRGYYRDTMGEKGKNDRGIYDDAVIVISPTAYAAFNANCDPALFQPGIATLKAGVWRYKLGIHGLSKPKEQQYEALVQAAPVTVLRDGGGEETGFFGINIHRGSHNSTSSLGCQTIYPDEWDAFIALVKQQMAEHGRSEIPYVLNEAQ